MASCSLNGLFVPNRSQVLNEGLDEGLTIYILQSTVHRSIAASSYGVYQSRSSQTLLPVPWTDWPAAGVCTGCLALTLLPIIILVL